ncbi:MAG: hypothetical protein LH628_08125 [Microcoleus sp. CAN_BIN18]|nr:hypothetical protein [Microcoleus sp. CAN_BIN18]
MPSRASSKSSLSPSVSSRSSAIDLGKNSGVDLGSKAQTSLTTGGIGVTQEVGNIGGVTVTGGVSIDISPIGLSISGRSDYEDPSKSTISIAGGAEIPGGILGVSGGLTVNTSTGQIEGGSIGGEIVGIGVGVSKSPEGVGVEISLQIPFTPIEISLGFEFPEEDAKQPTPTPTPGGGDDRNGFDFSDPNKWPLLDPNCNYGVVGLIIPYTTLCENSLGWNAAGGSGTGYAFEKYSRNRLSKGDFSGLSWDISYRRWFPVVKEEQEEGRIQISFSSASVRYTEGQKIIKNYSFGVDGIENGGTLLVLPRSVECLLRGF